MNRDICIQFSSKKYHFIFIEMAILSSIIKRALKTGADYKLKRTQKKIQEKVLRKLLQKASKTIFGQYYDFTNILKSEDIIAAFQAQVPIHDYDKMHNEWWHLQLKGIENVTWHSKIDYYGLSSGTSGAASKYIPESEEMLRAMRKAALKTFISLVKSNSIGEGFLTKDFLLIGGSATLNKHKKYSFGDLSGINANFAPIWLKSQYKPGLKIAKLESWQERIDYIAKKAPKWDIVAISGLPSWVQLTLEHVIAYHGVENIHQIWPNLQCFVSGGIAIEPYKKSLNALMAKPILFMDTYLASEGFIAYQNDIEKKSMSMILDNGIFYEFVPFNEENFDSEGNLLAKPQVLTIEQVEVNKDYAIVLSNCAGAWRYLIGDTIRFINTENAEIIISGRTKHFLSVCGEHLSVDNMNNAIQYIQDIFNVDIPEYTVAATKTGTHYAHKWYIAHDGTLDKKEMAIALDKQLQQINDDYAAERNSMLQMLDIEFVTPQLFHEYLLDSGKSHGQSKFPRVLKSEQLNLFDAFLRKASKSDNNSPTQ